MAARNPLEPAIHRHPLTAPLNAALGHPLTAPLNAALGHPLTAPLKSALGGIH
jgi:hypothetical protein